MNFSKWMLALSVILLGVSGCRSTWPEKHPGEDVCAVFRRAAEGEPITIAAIGGSITQSAGPECWIGEGFKARFPKSKITMVNAGMSATGSDLGIFRLRKDVMVHEPDLVLIEFAVNDGGKTDEAAIRYVESLVVRLKKSPKPPAVVLFRAASKNPAPDRLLPVARHYNLLHVDAQPAVEEYNRARNLKWTDSLMTDDVHLAPAGHVLYSEILLHVLNPDGRMGPCSDLQTMLPPPLSSKPLILDGDMQPLTETSFAANGWAAGPPPKEWWKRFFSQVVWANSPGASLEIPLNARMGGILYLLSKDAHGKFYLSLDGNFPRLINCAERGGYTFAFFGPDLPSAAHTITAATTPDSTRPVGIGWFLTAQREGDFSHPAERGVFSAVRLGALRFRPIPAEAWEWSGPYGGARPTLEGIDDLKRVFPPELGNAEWRTYSGTGEWVDFAKLTGIDDRGVCYGRTVFRAKAGGRRIVGLSLDYYGKVWVNGKVAKTIADAHGSVSEPVFFDVDLQPGVNEILIKLHAGSRGSRFSCSVEE